MRWAAVLGALVALVCAGAALALHENEGDDAPAPAIVGSTDRGGAATAARSRADEVSETLDRSVCRRRDLGQWDRERAPRDFAPRCMRPSTTP